MSGEGPARGWCPPGTKARCAPATGTLPGSHDSQATPWTDGAGAAPLRNQAAWGQRPRGFRSLALGPIPLPIHSLCGLGFSVCRMGSGLFSGISQVLGLHGEHSGEGLKLLDVAGKIQHLPRKGSKSQLGGRQESFQGARQTPTPPRDSVAHLETRLS